MKNSNVVKASSLAELARLVKKSILRGLTPIGLPSMVWIRNKFDNREAVHYQAMITI